MAEVREIAYVAVGDNHARHVAQIVASPDWRVSATLLTLNAALQGFVSGKYVAIMLEDTQDCPAALHILRELCNPILYLAPIMILVDKERENDESSFDIHFGFICMMKPISRMVVIQTFTNMVRRINSPSGIAAHACSKAYGNGEGVGPIEALPGFTQLVKDPTFAHRLPNFRALTKLRSVVGDTARGGIHIDGFRLAEADLLRHAKSFPSNIVAYLILSSLYADYSMTILARRLVQNAAVSAQNFSLATAFLAQLHLLLGEMEDAIIVLGRLLKMRYLPEQTSFSLAKLYCSVGRADQADNLLAGQAGRFNALRAAWIDTK